MESLIGHCSATAGCRGRPESTGRSAPTFAELGEELGVSASTAHSSVKRLNAAGLIQSRGGQHHANLDAIEEFLVHGVRYAFPAQLTRRMRGVPTAHSAPILSDALSGQEDPVVWPLRGGPMVGEGIEPLIPAAAAIAERSPRLYDLLAIVDAIRVGTARDREVAASLLRQRLNAPHA